MRSLRLGLTLLLVLSFVAVGTARADEPAPVDHKYELGARIRGIWVTPLMMAPFVQTNSGMSSMSGGAEFVYHRASYDVVTSLDLSFINVQDGNFLGVNHSADVDTHYLQFGDFGQLTFLSADVSIIGHHDFTDWFQLRYGGGVGLGAVLGDVKIINDGPQCSQQNFHNVNQCFPVTVGPLGQAGAEQKLKATENGTTSDSAQDPHRHVSGDKPPVMAVVNLLVGFRFKVQRHLAFDVEVGFRDAIFFGGGFHYLF
ncbi:MAG: hypothetical protein ACHQ17_01710 [Polyangia bacterium]|jgi:hypothetical protein